MQEQSRARARKGGRMSGDSPLDAIAGPPHMPGRLSSTDTAESTRASTSRIVPAALVLAYFGAYIAVMSPPTVSMALRVVDVVGADDKLSVLATVLSIGALAGAVASPLLGRLSDRTTLAFGRRRTWLVLGPVLGIAGLALIGLCDTVPLLTFGWVLAQAGWSGTLMVCQALLSERIPDTMRGRVSGLMGAGMPIGMVGGTFIVSFTESSPVLMLLVPGLIGVVTAAFLVAVVPDAPADRAALHHLGPKELLQTFYVDPRRHPAYSWAFLSRFLMFSGVFIILTYQTYIVSDRIGFTGASTADKVFQSTVVMVTGSVAASVLFGVLGDRTGRLKLFLRIGVVAVVVGLLLLTLGDSFGIFLAGLALIGIGQGAYLADDLPMITRVLPDPDDAAQELGVYNLGLVLPQMLIPLYGAALIGSTGDYPHLFAVGAVCAAAAAFTLIGVRGIK
ncbi:MFS transporter [Streptomyces sp. NPDC057690]|uniref:MFS transporter n=1 Tax=Streptomyces sp. NPDC057690 TaxID=3346214 RepID=UPI0036A87A2C